MILFFLFCRPLLVVLFETTPRLTLFNFFEWQVLGYLAAIPEGGGVLGKKAMATLTHMSTGGRLYENAVLHAINRCVTTQLFLFDRPSTAVGAEPEDEEEAEAGGNGGERGAQNKNKKKNKNSSTVADGRHNTLIAGLSGFVAATGHAEVLKPVVGVIGEWVATVAYGWINASTPLAQMQCWESGELLKYLKLATASCTYKDTALKFGR